MNFLALMVGLGLERLLTHLFHLREFHWLDPLLDPLYRRLGPLNRYVALAAVVLVVALFVVPVAAVEMALDNRLAHIPLFVYAVVVLLFCLGPRDLIEEVDDYRKAMAEDDRAELELLATELLDRVPRQWEGVPEIERAIYAQANNRIFGVVFWFIVLGPTGAWLFRISDLMRRRAIVYATTTEGDVPQSVRATIAVHEVLAWVPARLLMVGYTLAGSYDSAVQAWREHRPEQNGQLFPGPDDQLLGAVGHGAVEAGDAEDLGERAGKAVDLVSRTLWMIWCPILALLTLYDWIV